MGGERIRYAGVIVDVRAEAVNRIFHYAIPPQLEEQIKIGHRVLVPFGRRQIEGYVVEFSTEVKIEKKRIRAIIRLLDPEPIILPSLVELAYFMEKEYLGLFSEALQLMLPPAFRYGKERVGVKSRQFVRLLIEDPPLRASATAQKRVISILQAKQEMLASELLSQAKASYSTLHSLEKQGVISVEEIQVEREVTWDQIQDSQHNLTIEQKQALHLIRSERKAKNRPILIHGVTGSGKTEIYLQAIEEILALGKQAIVLVPEIALTTQTVNRFAARFGKRISVLHSGLSQGERFDQWWKTYHGEVDVVIGARSAVFAPTPNLGLIVIDEEHEGSYKQTEGSVRYQTRDVAIYRSELVQAQVLLGTATPAIESYHRALQGSYALVQLTKRVADRALPHVEILDMRQEFEQGNRTMFSGALRQALGDLVDTKKQAIILLNRRGFSSFVLCRECGEVIECPNCKVSLTYHQSIHRLRCHYCLHKESMPNKCPNCASPYLRQFGVGTEQLQEVLQKEFPQLKTLRLDADTTRRKGSHAQILKQFGAGAAQVLVGTQMVAKGLDFPQVTLVGVLSADLALNFPDLRAAERTFQLLTQVAGRSGRGDWGGQVIIQTYDSNHFALRCAENHDYLSFYRQEISFRRSLGYPPFRQLTRILCSGGQRESQKVAEEIRDFLLKHGVEPRDLLGPSEAPISKIQGRFRFQMLVKSDNPLQELLRQIPNPPADVHVTIDIDPQLML